VFLGLKLGKVAFFLLSPFGNLDPCGILGLLGFGKLILVFYTLFSYS